MREPKSPNIARNRLRAILNYLHYKQRCIDRLDNTTLSLDVLLKKKNVTNHPKPKLRTFEFYLEREANIELVKLGNRHTKM